MRLIGRRAIALVVITYNQEYLADSASDTIKYGKNAINGVNKYVINDERYPKAYLKFINAMKKVETPVAVKKER